MEENNKAGIFVAISMIALFVMFAIAAGSTHTNTPTSTSTSTSTPATKTSTQQVVKTETKTDVEKYKTIETGDNNLPKGRSKVVTEGKNGEVKRTYKVTYEGTKEVSRKLVKEEMTKAPVNRVIAKGTVPWRCYDATSYNRNPYDDNYCVNQINGSWRYVSDSEAEWLDPSYRAPTYGAPRYNI